MGSKQSKLREVREELREKGRRRINIYRSSLPFLPSLPSILPSRVRRDFSPLYIEKNNFSTLPPICFFKGSKGRTAFRGSKDSVFTLPLSLIFKGRVREELREEEGNT
jgi:hypothetical protein